MTTEHDDKIDANVAGPVLARWLGVSGKVIYDLAKAGIIERGAGGLYALEVSVRKYCEHLRGNR
jgi:hypothetical protein